MGGSTTVTDERESNPRGLTIPVRRGRYRLNSEEMDDRNGHSTPERIALSPFLLSMKRCIDIAIVICIIALLAIPMIAIAIVVKLTSRGPVLYSQERIGYRGTRFIIYKYRTMVVDAEKSTGPIWAKNDDPRCTRIGLILRRTSLDELPQLINVLRGDMSLVGPRPERPCFVQQFSCEYPDYPLRLEMPPGLTGLAQINGWRGNTSLRARLDCDLEYIRQWSLRRDLHILLKTPPHIWGGANAC